MGGPRGGTILAGRIRGIREVRGARGARGAERARRRVLSLGRVVLALAAALACATEAGPSRDAGPARGPASPARADAARLTLGVAGLVGPRVREHAAALASTGARAASVPCRLLTWGPGAAAPDLAAVDAAVAALQDAGFLDLALCLGLRAAPDDTADADRLVGVRGPVPAAAHHAAFAAWAAAVAERYDGDGREDAPGLAAPVRLLRLGTALAPGSLEPFPPYPALLAQVRRAVREAAPEVRLAPAPLRARGTPPGALDARLEALLSAPDAFDLWSVEASGTPAELDAWLAWLARRDPARPAAVFEARTAPLAEGGAPARCDAEGPERAELGDGVAESERCALADAFRGLLAGEPRAVAWSRAAAARDLVAKILVAAGRGAARIEVGSATDDPWWSHPALEASAGLAAWSGLLRADATAAHPGFYALRQVAGVLEGRSRVARVDVGVPHVWVYALRGRAGAAWVAWYAPPRFAGPGQLASARIVRVPLDAADGNAPRLRVIPVVAELGVSDAQSEATPAEVRGDRLWLEVTPTPLLVVPAD